jgi:hypothetical protein
VAYREAAVLGGRKFGRCFDLLPGLGVELETNFARHDLPEQQVRLSPHRRPVWQRFICPIVLGVAYYFKNLYGN